MPEITVGLPVFNGMPLLEESLSSLERQTLKDIRIIIADNASTDGTSKAVSDFVASHPNAIHLRSSETVPVRVNFRRALEAADTPFFAWRAADDSSSDDYFERLLGLLKRDEKLQLAASRIRVVYKDRPEKFEDVVGLDLPPGVERISTILNHARSSWIYGLWRREALLKAFQYTETHYTELPGFDDFILFQAIYAGGFTGTNDTAFTQRRRTFDATTRKSAATQGERWRRLRYFHAVCRAWAAEHVPATGPIDAARREIAILRYAFHKNQKLHKFLFSRRNLPIRLQNWLGYRID